MYLILLAFSKRTKKYTEGGWEPLVLFGKVSKGEPFFFGKAWKGRFYVLFASAKRTQKQTGLRSATSVQNPCGGIIDKIWKVQCIKFFCKSLLVPQIRTAMFWTGAKGQLQYERRIRFCEKSKLQYGLDTASSRLKEKLHIIFVAVEKENWCRLVKALE